MNKLLQTTAVLLLAAVAAAQGISLKKDGTVLYGSPAVSTCPAVVVLEKVRKATPEWKTIRSEGVEKGTGRYDLLLAAMTERIKQAVAEVARQARRDCVLPKQHLKDARGLEVADLTGAVLRQLRS